MPFTLGNEASGQIVALGQGASFAIGDTVAAYTAGGAFAEYCIAQESKTVKLPADGLTTREAATVLLQGLTALTFTKRVSPISYLWYSVYFLTLIHVAWNRHVIQGSARS